MAELRTIQNAAVIGHGNWGTAVAVLLAQKGVKVKLWGPFPEDIEVIKRSGRNEKYLPGIDLPNLILPVADLAEALAEVELVVLVIPSQFAREVLASIAKIGLPSNIYLLNAAKGIEVGTLKRMSEVVVEELGDGYRYAVLSGATIANDVVRGVPAKAVIASSDTEYAGSLRELFNSNTLEVTTSEDVLGVELGGSFKNVLAVAYGIVCGLGESEDKARQLLEEGYIEMSALALAMGAKSETLRGASWIDDLIATCFSPHGRNRYVGERIGKGKKLNEILAGMQMVAEGPETTKSVYQLSQKYGMEVPIVELVYEILHKDANPKILLELVAKVGLV